MTNYLKQLIYNTKSYDACDLCINSCEFALTNRIIDAADFVPDYIPTTQQYKWIEGIYNKKKETGECEYLDVLGYRRKNND